MPMRPTRGNTTRSRRPDARSWARWCSSGHNSRPACGCFSERRWAVAANDTSASTSLQRYLDRMDAALAGLSLAERREILLETQSHVAEQAERSPMLSVPEILAELGEPEAYARTFLVDGQPALPHRQGALHGLARLATGSWTALPLLLFVLCCYSVAVMMLFVAVNEIQEPETTGFWVEQTATGRDIGLTVSGPPTPTRGPDLLGGWLIPITLSIATMIHVAMRALLRRVLPREPTGRHTVRAQPPPRT